MASGGSSFSYAQAAKGEVVSQPTAAEPTINSPPDGSVQQPAVESGKLYADLAQKPAIPNGEPSPEPDGKTATAVLTLKAANHQATPKNEQVVKDDPEPSQLTAEDQAPMSSSIVLTNGPAADEPGTVTPNDSESAWERVSQPSQTDTKSGSKADSENGDTKSSWEHLPPPNQLKEAPLPAFNIWHKRAADAKTKIQEAKPTVPGTTGPDHLAKKPTELQAEQAPKKKVAAQRQMAADRSLQSSQENISAPVASHTNKTSSAPPPSMDTLSWPTPESAKGEEKKKVTEKTEKPEKSDGEKTPSKPHGKEKWEKLPYVPTAVFNTPLPTNRRGGRAGRGGREGTGRGASTANGGDKTQAGGPISPSVPSGRGETVAPRSGPTAKGKRASSAGPPIGTEARRPGEDVNQKPISNPRLAHPDGRRATSGQQSDSRQWSPSARGHGIDADNGIRSQQTQDPSARNAPDRRNDASRSAGDVNGYGPRERVEGRSDRGRGGYRGRGNFSNVANTANASGQPYQAQHNAQPNFVPPKSQSYSSDPRRESMPVGSMFSGTREPRHGRGNSRSQSIPTASYGRYAGGPQHLSQLHTDHANMFYPQAPSAVVSAVPYPGYMEHMQLAGLVQLQMEYYFSVDNLCKDMFLRKRMDTQGLVFLDILTNFNRIKQLTQDPEMIRFVCQRSIIIELLTGSDGIDRVRRQGDWQQWVLPYEERDETVRNDGPAHLHLPPAPYMMPYGDPKAMAMAAVPKTAHPGAHFRPEQMVMGEVQNSSMPPTETPTTTTPTETSLSAAVPDFTPSMPMHTGVLPTHSPAQGGQEFVNGSITSHGIPNGAVPGHVHPEK